MYTYVYIFVHIFRSGLGNDLASMYILGMCLALEHMDTMDHRTIMKYQEFRIGNHQYWMIIFQCIFTDHVL